MPNNLGRDKIPWPSEIWSSIDKAVADEHKLTAVYAQFVTPPVPDMTMAGTVAADTVLEGDDGVLSVDESETRSIVEIAVQFRVRSTQIDTEASMKTAESLATRAANLLARGEDLFMSKGLAAIDDPLFQNKSIRLRAPVNTKKPSSPVDSFLFAGNKQTIEVHPTEPGIYGENTYAAVAQGYALLQENHYGRQALVLPSTIYADTFATRTTTLDIPAITAERIKGLIGNYMYGTSTLPALNDTSPAKGVLLALDGNTMDLVVQMGPTVEVVTQETGSGDYILDVYERFALRLKDPKAVVELDFLAK